MNAIIKDEYYQILGKLFFAIAAADHKITQAERKALHQLVKKVWNSQEAGKDPFGTDLAEEIEFSFDFEEENALPDDDFAEFSDFFRRNRTLFNKVTRDNIMKTARAIATAYRRENKEEKKILAKLNTLLNSK